MRIRRRFLSLPFALVVFGLAACAGPKPLLPTVDVGAVARYRLAGYDTGTLQTIERRQFASPPSDEVGWNAHLVRPAYDANQAGLIPVIVYVPALGRGSNAPNRWIDAWARRGYAVFSVQPLPGDATAWQSPAAIDGDFDAVARDRYAAAVMPRRIARLRTILQALRARSRRREANVDDLDWSHVAIAGSGLGAYTVQRIAATGALASFGVHAYLAISPYAATRAHRSHASDAPILMVSSQDDIDPDGMVSDPLARHLAFDRLHSGGEDYYLEFASATHRWLDGATDEDTLRGDAPDMAPVDGTDDAASDGGGKPGAAAARREREAHRRAVLARSRLLTDTARAAVSFTDITTAFLDANLRDRAAARSWLAAQAPRWLQGARLKHRDGMRSVPGRRR